jgi:site-specific recombinase XerD
MKKVIETFRTREELDKLVSQLNKKYRSGIRNRSMLAVLCYAGLRVSGLLNLKISDIKTRDHAIRVNNAKKESSR